MAEQKLSMKKSKQRPIAEWAQELAAASRRSMRTCALEWRRSRARGWQVESDRWLIFALYYRAASQEWLTGKPAMSAQLARAVDQMVRKLAEGLSED